MGWLNLLYMINIVYPHPMRDGVLFSLDGWGHTTTMQTIVRIAHPLVTVRETNRAVGPYNAARVYVEQTPEYARSEIFQCALQNVSDAVLEMPDRPTPREEGMGIIPTQQSVFTSVEQAENWFVYGNDAMREADFRMFTYEAAPQHVRRGRQQAICDLRRARLVKIETIPFVDTYSPESMCWVCCMAEVDCDCGML